MIEKKNEIWIGYKGRGYFLGLTNNHYKYRGKIESYYKKYLQRGNFYELIGTLLNTPNDFYEKGIKLEFRRNPKVKIQKEEEKTIEKLMNRLEKDAKEIKDLKYTLKTIKNLSNDNNPSNRSQ